MAERKYNISTYRVPTSGRPMVTYVDRGQRSATVGYYSEAINPATGAFETSEVWYMGCKYRCVSTGTPPPA